MRLSRIGCLGIGLIVVLLVMMAGLIGLTLSLRGSAYTPEQQQILASNYRLYVNQSAPQFNAYGYVSDELSLLYSSTPIDSPPIATSARESHITADLNVRYEQRQGVTITAYDLDFGGDYVVANPDTKQVILDMDFPFPQNASVLSAVTFAVDSVEPPGVTYSMQGIHWRALLEPGQESQVQVRYRAEGVGSFAYSIPSSQRIRDFDLRVTVKGAQEINLPDSALKPTKRQDAADGTTLNWRYSDVITNRSVTVELPARPSLAFAQRIEKLGEFFTQLALAAPFLTLLFILCLLAVARLEGLKMTLEHNTLLGIGFFLYYPLFIFTAGFVDLPLAFAIALIVAGALVMGYGTRVIGKQLSAIYLIPLLVVFYGLLTRGLTAPRYLGIMLVVSSVLLVALFMWRITQSRTLLAVAGVGPVQEASVMNLAPVERMKDAPAQSDRAERARRYCIHCGQPVEPGFKFCPQCGEEAQMTRKCTGCGLEYIPDEDLPGFCPACGKKQ